MGRNNDHLSASATQIYPTHSATSHSSSPNSTRYYQSHSPPSNTHHLTPPPQSYSPSSQTPSTMAINRTPTAANRRAPWVRILDLARLILTLLAIGAAAAVVGCTAHPLSVYDTTRLADGFALPPMWPEDFDIRPTRAELVAGAVVLLVAILYILVGVVPVPRRFFLPALLTSTFFAVIGMVAAVAGTAYSRHKTTQPDYDRDYMESWTCRWVDGASNANQIFADGLADFKAPAGFERICNETHVGFGLLAILIGVETLVVAVTAACAWLEIKAEKSERAAVDNGHFEKDTRAARRSFF